MIKYTPSSTITPDARPPSTQQRTIALFSSSPDRTALRDAIASPSADPTTDAVVSICPRETTNDRLSAKLFTRKMLSSAVHCF